MPHADVQVLAEMVAYQPGSVVSRKVLGARRGNVTLFKMMLVMIRDE